MQICCDCGSTCPYGSVLIRQLGNGDTLNRWCVGCAAALEARREILREEEEQSQLARERERARYDAKLAGILGQAIDGPWVEYREAWVKPFGGEEWQGHQAFNWFVERMKVVPPMDSPCRTRRPVCCALCDACHVVFIPPTWEDSDIVYSRAWHTKKHDAART